MKTGAFGGTIGTIKEEQDVSLFDELENIFKKNKKWIDEQREREEFLREMAEHYNQSLTHEMSSIQYASTGNKQRKFH